MAVTLAMSELNYIEQRNRIPLLRCPSFFYSSVSKQYVKGQGGATSPGIPTASAPKRINQVLLFPMTMMLVSRANVLLGIESNGRFPNAFSLCSLQQQHHTQSRIFLDRMAHNLTPLLYTTFRVSDLSLRSPSGCSLDDHIDFQEE